MLRASASFLNAGRFSDDWHPGRSGWVARNLYLDAAEYLRSDTTAAAADYRMSYHKALFSSTTLEPYGHLQGSVIRTTGVDRDVRAGAGLRWNVWFGGSRYDAPPHKLSIGVEYQQAFVTYLTERRGLFLAINSRW
jgi:adsorption protein A